MAIEIKINISDSVKEPQNQRCLDTESAAFAVDVQRRQDSKPVSLEDFEKFIQKYQESSSRLEFA